jgi:hypothetical protein
MIHHPWTAAYITQHEHNRRFPACSWVVVVFQMTGEEDGRRKEEEQEGA